MSKKQVSKVETKVSLGKTIIMFPSKLLMPVKGFLTENLKKLQKTKKEVLREDPFKNSHRTENNASPDSDAEEQFGHARVSAIKDELNKKIIQTKKALSMVKLGKYGICEDCGRMIDTDRLMVFPETTLCATDAKKREK